MDPKDVSSLLKWDRERLGDLNNPLHEQGTFNAQSEYHPKCTLDKTLSRSYEKVHMTYSTNRNFIKK